ncbi:hypothetical protein FLX56_04075 [Synechococcus moorigangaii CMS01]|nr:hypothetical protein [Synechococcus moorigangaii CMS01]
MNQAPPSFTNAKLQAALDSLDLDLDLELQRYQRQRPTPPSPAAAHELSALMATTDSPAVDSQALEAPTMPPGPLSPWEQVVPPPEDYLESSEELLKSLDAEPQTPAPKSAFRWPLALGLLGAALIGGGLVALAIAIPDLFTPKTAPETALEPTASPPRVDPAPEPEAIPSTVNLASQEFIELRLENLSIIDPGLPTESEDTAAEATASTETTAPPANQNQATAMPLPAPMPGFPGTPLATPDGLKLGYYYVIFRNTSPAAVNRAKTVIEGAFVRQFPGGRAIQMAEVDAAAKADELVRQLKAQNIAAEVYYHQLSPAS